MTTKMMFKLLGLSEKVNVNPTFFKMTPSTVREVSASYRIGLYEKIRTFPLSILDIEARLGIEIEGESVLWSKDSPYPPVSLIGFKPDGSLRNSGVEMVTTILHPQSVIPTLVILYELLKKASPRTDFSWRTSIQVHIDVRNLTSEQFLIFVILYLMFERPLFNFAAPERMASNNCVPLSETNILFENLAAIWKEPDNLDLILNHWHKYGALGTGRLKDNPDNPGQGTLEFRHMQGTWEVTKIVNWINLILSLYSTTLRMSKEMLENVIRELNTYSEYQAFKNYVFDQNFCGGLIPNETLQENMARTISRLKLALFPSSIRSLYSTKKHSQVLNLIQKANMREKEGKELNILKLNGKIN